MAPAQGPGSGKTAVSFYLDDMAPYVIKHADGEQALHPVPVSALEEFALFVQENDLAGAVSVIPGLHCLLTNPQTDVEHDYAEFVAHLYEYNLDTHMEIMTHGPLFNFEEMKAMEGTSEWEWLDDHSVSLGEYRRYFRNTIGLAGELEVRYTGFTTPGTHANMNPQVWRALAELAHAGDFPSPAVPVFAEIDGISPQLKPLLMARSGRGASYALHSGHGDFLAGWSNSPDRIDVGRYLTSSGSGRLGDLIRSQSPMAIFHMHWPGINPATGLGWLAFKELVERLERQFGDRIVWKRPSEIALDAHLRERSL